MDDEIYYTRRGSIAHVVLNRPQALNALTLPMVRKMRDWLGEWGQDPTIEAVFVEGAGDKAFCAGGDVRAVYEAGKSQDRSLTRDFFLEEYQMNRAIYHFHKPYICLLNGITMGGGVGISVHGSHRIATEKTLFAMPEAGIGFFPDVGCAHFMANHCAGSLAEYLCLTGARLKGQDVVYAGIATHYLDSDKIQAFKQNPLDPSLLTSLQGGIAHMEQINRHFVRATMEDILVSLHADPSDWAKETYATLRALCPLSLKVTLKHVRECRKMGFDQAMDQDFVLSQAFMDGLDFYEGIRAVLVDKDKAPKWSHACIEDVVDDVSFGRGARGG